MVNPVTVEMRLQRKYGDHWQRAIIDLINEGSRVRITPQQTDAFLLNVSWNSFKPIFEDLGAEGKMVWTLAGDRVVIERADGGRVVLVDRSGESTGE